jgi:hypothetical protein
MVKIKGTVVLDTIRAVVEREGQHGYDTLIGMLDDDAKKLFQNEVLATAWYPLDAFTSFLEVDIQHTAGGHAQVLIGRAELVVERELRGVYRVFARLSSPVTVIKRLMTIHGAYFQGLQIGSACNGRGSATVTYDGFEPCHRLMQYTLIGFYRKALDLCGAKQVQVGFSSSDVGGKQRWQFGLSWR